MTSMPRYLFTVFAVLVVSCSRETTPSTIVAPPQSTPVYSTLNDAGGLTNTDIVFSSARVDGEIVPSIVFDDFTLPTTATISEARWQGLYCQLPRYGSPAPAVATGFVVSFYSDRDDSPAFQPLREDVYPVAQVGQRLERNAMTTCTGEPGSAAGLYDYTVQLNPPFAVTAGVRYWFAVQALMPAGGSPRWGWRAGTAGNGRAWGAGGVSRFQIPRDFALAFK